MIRASRLGREAERRRRDSIGELPELDFEPLDELVRAERQCAIFEPNICALRVSDTGNIAARVDSEHALNFAHLHLWEDLGQMTVRGEVALHARKFAGHEIGWFGEREQQRLPVYPEG